MVFKNPMLLVNLCLIVALIVIYVINNLCDTNVINLKKKMDNNMIMNLNMSKKINHLKQKNKLCVQLLESFDDGCGSVQTYNHLTSGRSVHQSSASSSSSCSEECMLSNMRTCCEHTFAPNNMK